MNLGDEEMGMHFFFFFFPIGRLSESLRLGGADVILRECRARVTTTSLKKKKTFFAGDFRSERGSSRDWTT